MALDDSFLLFVMIGFAAQIIDGAIGMAFGVTATSAMLALGVAPAPASAAVHVAKVVTGAASGLAHLTIGNVDGQLCRRLALFGMVGGVTGAIAVSVAPTRWVTPVIAVYLLAMGAFVIWSSLYNVRLPLKRVGPVGLAGGFVDSAGGGWGPLVTSTLMAAGHEPRMVVGSVNLSELFVSLTTAATFLAFIGIAHWQIVIGLVVGGAIAAPLAAVMCRYLPARAMMRIVGVVIIVLGCRTLYTVAQRSGWLAAGRDALGSFVYI